MTDPALIRLFAYSDWANATVLEAAGELSDEQLDRPLEIGPKPGSLRRIINHILAGEAVWLSRWQGNVENAWPNERLPTPVAEIAAHLEKVALNREVFFSTLGELHLGEMRTYRDSKGTLYKALLRDMLLQGLVHSTHHRSQAVNAIRQLGGQPPELDFMYHARVVAG